MITYGELKKLVGSKPFVWINDGYTTQHVSQLISEEGTVVNDLAEGIELQPSVSSCTAGENQPMSMTVVDWFDSSETVVENEHKNCTCEWIAVLQSGCQCGSIIPYAKRITHE
jgi:hypothetical protein